MANVLKMATVADIVTLIKSGHSNRRILRCFRRIAGRLRSTAGSCGPGSRRRCREIRHIRKISRV